MPFDGGEFPRFPEWLTSGPSGAVLAEPWAWRAWARLRALLPAGPGDRGRVPSDEAVCLLRTARALIETEATWVTGTYRTSDGRRCAVGALHKAARDSEGQYGRRVRHEAHSLLLGAARGRGFDSVERMNDNSTHAEVLAAFDAALAKAAR